jgi:hypothetical protein
VSYSFTSCRFSLGDTCSSLLLPLLGMPVPLVVWINCEEQQLWSGIGPGRTHYHLTEWHLTLPYKPGRNFPVYWEGTLRSVMTSCWPKALSFVCTYSAMGLYHKPAMATHLTSLLLLPFPLSGGALCLLSCSYCSTGAASHVCEIIN